MFHGCGGSDTRPLANRSQADFVNGGFEAGDLSGWTVTTNLNPVIATFPPTTISDLGLGTGGTDRTFARMGATPESQIPAGLSAAESLRFPRFGMYSAVVNELGANNNSNTIFQQITTTQADVDALDGKIHVRFGLAPVLQNPGHVQTNQPYFFIELRNVTKNTLLFSSFNFANQAGVPWKNNAANTIQYTDWQLFDVAPGPTGIAIGDQLSMQVVASGCSQGGHYGHIYIDGFGTFLPGLTVVASGPQAANSGTDITYTYVAKNGSTTPADNVMVTIAVPPNTTFVSVNGATCTDPGVGMTGTVTCNLGTLNPGAGSNFQMTVHIDPTATGTINHGNYTIQGTGVNPLLGPLVQTTVTTGVTYTDLGISVSNGIAALDWGSPVTYTVVVTNNGPSAVTGAQLSNSVPADLMNVTWTCAGQGGGVCAAGSGNGALNGMANLPVGASVTYTVMGTVVAGTGNGLLNYLVSVAPPSGVMDSSNNNNSAVDTDNIGPVRQLTVNKGNSSGAGTIVSAPAAIRCDAQCQMQSANFTDGAQVTLTAVAAPGSTFTGWTGACAAAGTNPQCTVSMTQAQTVGANFDLPSFPVTINIPGGNGTITCPSPVVQGRDLTCTVTPTPGFALATLVINGTNYIATFDPQSNSFIVTNVQSPQDITATFLSAPGNTCTDGTGCASGFCISGICCNTACTNGCESCTVPGAEGTCTSACGAFACDSAVNMCKSSCVTNDDCVPGGLCAAGSCLPPAGQYQLSGGGIAACSYNGPKGTSTSAELALLAMVAFFARRRVRRAAA